MESLNETFVFDFCRVLSLRTSVLTISSADIAQGSRPTRKIASKKLLRLKRLAARH